jgi:hypothetical protein
MSFGAKTSKRIFPDVTLGKVLGTKQMQMYGVASNLFAYADKQKIRDGKILKVDAAMKEIWKNSGDKSRVPPKVETFKFIKILWMYIKKKKLFHEP